MAQRRTTTVADQTNVVASTTPSIRSTAPALRSVNVGAVLHQQCDDLTHSHRNFIAFMCSCDDVHLPRILASQVLWAARQLISEAYRGFTDGQPGCIAVATHLTDDFIQLVVEYRRPMPITTDKWMANDQTLVQKAVKGFGGRLEVQEQMDGGRTMVQIPLQRH